MAYHHTTPAKPDREARNRVLRETKGIFKDDPLDSVAIRQDANEGGRDYTTRRNKFNDED